MQAALALRTSAKVVPVECRPEPDGTYRMVFHKPLEFSEGATAAEVAQLCWNVLEPSIHEQPECWLWAYKHWRFRPANDKTGRYPFYANVAKRFDKMLAKQEKSAIASRLDRFQIAEFPILDANDNHRVSSDQRP